MNRTWTMDTVRKWEGRAVEWPGLLGRDSVFIPSFLLPEGSRLESHKELEACQSLDVIFLV